MLLFYSCSCCCVQLMSWIFCGWSPSFFFLDLWHVQPDGDERIAPMKKWASIPHTHLSHAQVGAHTSSHMTLLMCVCVWKEHHSLSTVTHSGQLLYTPKDSIYFIIYILRKNIYICIYIITKLCGGKNINTLDNMIKYVEGTEGLIALEASKQSYIKKRFPNCKSRTHILKRCLPKHLNFA